MSVRGAIKRNNPARENAVYLADKGKELFARRRNISLVSDQIRPQCRARRPQRTLAHTGAHDAHDAHDAHGKKHRGRGRGRDVSYCRLLGLWPAIMDTMARKQ